jgi:alpha-tubulin suppressor-like RCC1 family protein
MWSLLPGEWEYAVFAKEHRVRAGKVNKLTLSLIECLDLCMRNTCISSSGVQLRFFRALILFLGIALLMSCDDAPYEGAYDAGPDVFSYDTWNPVEDASDAAEDAVDVLEPLDAVVQLVAGQSHTCALLDTGAVRCWGRALNGQLGYGNTTDIGDNETPASGGDVTVGGTVTQLAAGSDHTCALLNTGAVRCWGLGSSGQLGYGNTNNIGDNETPASAGDVTVGGTVTQLAAGIEHTCALLNTGAVRCWGLGLYGQLGYGNSNSVGDNETPASAGDVTVGGTATQLAAGGGHSCARLNYGGVRCWGRGFDGQLGYGNTNSIGDNETPASAGDVTVGGTVTQLAAGYSHTCALLNSNAVRCWGWGLSGQLGYANENSIGDNETPASAGDVNVGGPVSRVVAAFLHTCALLDTGAVRCWGAGDSGTLGYGNTNDIGDNETPSSAGSVTVGGAVSELAAGAGHNCALLETAAVRCWGEGADGKLGYANTNDIGDNETPASAGNVEIF